MDDKRARIAEEEPLFLFVEREIWSKSEEMRKFPTTLGFAEEACNVLGLCSSVSEGKRQIRDLLLTGEFSIDRVLAHHLASSPTLGVLPSYNLLRAKLGEKSVLFQPTPKLVLDKLIAMHDEAGVVDLFETKFASLDSPKQYNFDLSRISLLSFANVKKGLALLKRDAHFVSSKQLEKQLQSTCPLTYTVFTNKNVFHMRKAAVDMFELAKLAVAMERNKDSFVAFPSKTSNDVFLVHHYKHQLMRSTPGDIKLAVCSFANLHSAACAMQLGFLLPDFSNQVTLRGNVDQNMAAWVVFKVFIHDRHCSSNSTFAGDDDNILLQLCKEEIETFAGVGFVDSTTTLKVTEKRAMVPVAIGFAV